MRIEQLFVPVEKKVSGCLGYEYFQVKNISYFSAFYGNHFSLMYAPLRFTDDSHSFMFVMAQ